MGLIRLLACLILVAWPIRPGSATEVESESTAASRAGDVSFRRLLDSLEQRRMPDVMLWAIGSAEEDRSLSEPIRAQLPLFRANALTTLSRTEADPQKRSLILDEAEAAIDGFLAKSPTDDGLIEALSQKGNLLVERGRGMLAQAARPGADASRLKAESVAFFDEAIRTLVRWPASGDQTGSASGDAPATAEDAIVRGMRAVDAEIGRIRGSAGEVRARVAAKYDEIRPIAEGVESLDDELARIDAEKSAVESQAATKSLEVARLRLPPRPDRGDERKDPRRLREALESRQRDNLAEAVRLEQEAVALVRTFKELEERRRTKLGEKRKLETQLAKLKRERTVLDRELDTAEKPLEGALEPPLRTLESLRVKLLQTRFLAAEAFFEKSRAFDRSSPQWRTALEASTAVHRELVEKYGGIAAASMARLNQGRNEAILGDHPAALATLAPLYSLEAATGQPITALATSLKTKALALALDSWAATKQYRELSGPAPFDVAEYRRNPLLKFALAPAKGGKADADQVAVKFRAAILLDARAREIERQEPQAAGVLRQDALKLAQEVAQFGKDYAREARDLAGRLGKELPAVVRDDFATLVSDARAAVAAMQERNLQVKRSQLSDQAEAARVTEQAAADRDTAIDLLQRALAKIGAGTARDAAGVSVDAGAECDLRATLALLLYEAGRFEEAVTIGSDLVENHPNAPGSRKAAKAALAGLQAQALQGDPAARQAAKERLTALARRMVKAWPAEAEGSDAFAILVAAVLESRDPEAIRGMIDQIPATAARRAEFAMRLGTGLRREAREAAQADAATEPPDAILDAWNAAAAAAIDQGLACVETAGSLPADSAGRVAVAAALARAQMALESEDWPRVGRILNHAVYGPLTTMTRDDPAFSQGPLADGARAIALRYFVATEQPEEVRNMLVAMEKAAGEGADASAKLIANYLAIGRDLQSQLDSLTSGSRADSPEADRHAARIVDGFETVLEGLRRRDHAFTSQFFVACAYLSLATNRALETAVPKPKADEFLVRAADVCRRLLAQQEDVTTSAEDREEISRFEAAIRRRLALILKRQGEWDQARAQVDRILADPKHRNSLDAQELAADLLESAGRAAAGDDPAKADALLREAAVGIQADPVQIWGWGGIASKLARQAFATDDEAAPESRRRFFEARLRVAETLLERARLPGQADRDKRLEIAKASVVMTRKLYPDLGGSEFHRRFESVLEQIQKEQGTATPGGFTQLDQEAAASP